MNIAVFLLSLIIPATVMSQDLSLLTGKKISIGQDIIQFDDNIILDQSSGIEILKGESQSDSLGGWSLKVNHEDEQCPSYLTSCYNLYRVHSFEDHTDEENYKFLSNINGLNGIYYIFSFYSFDNYGISPPIVATGRILEEPSTIICEDEKHDPIFSTLDDFYFYFMYGLNRGLNAGFPQELCVERGIAREYIDLDGSLAYDIELLDKHGDLRGIMKISFSITQ